MKKLVKIITIEMAALWLLSGMMLDSESWIPFWVFVIATIYLSLVTYATFDWKENRMK